MANVKMFNISGSEVGTIDLNDSIFAVEVNTHVMHQAVLQYLANQRQGTQSALTRAEVRGGGRKPWRQKGTGRARQGSIRSPQWTGGGVVFAPKPRDYSFKLNKKVKRLALKSALTTKVNDGKLVVVDELTVNPKTKEMAAALNNLNAVKSLVVVEDDNKNAVIAARNIPTVKTASVSTVNVYDILKYDTLVLTKNVVAKIEEVYA
ncbi:MAG: 50S ribosomal protein L4 [Clostridia bacterium]|nr:50S ribosomal protein L4 [Clostridia bacterium]